MKRIILLLLLVLVPFALAQEAPPALENQQFYGKVYWDADQLTPTQVKAVIGSNEWISAVDPTTIDCGDLTCSADYGYESDSILRVQGSSGDTIVFFAGDVQSTTTATYQPWAVTKLGVNVATHPIKKEDCTEDWDCTTWGECSNNLQSRTCDDDNECDPEKLQITEEQSCGVSDDGGTGGGTTPGSSTSPPDTSSSSTCLHSWECTSWSPCSNNQQTRSCDRVDECDQKKAAGEIETVVITSKPAESKFCLTAELPSTPAAVPPPTFEPPTPSASCFDGVQNQGEQGVDCGGPCAACEEEGLSLMVYVIAFAVVLLVGVIALVYFLRKRGHVNVGVSAELKSVYAQGKSRGMTRQQVTQGLIAKGWDKDVLKNFSKSKK